MLDRFFSAENNTFSNFKLNLLQSSDELKQYIKKIEYKNHFSVGRDRVVLEVSKEKDNSKLIIVLKESHLPDDIYNEYINEVIFSLLFPELLNDVFLLPAERTGINLFYKELNTYRNSLINNLQKNKINPIEVFKDMIISKYPQPIADYIDFLNNMHVLKKQYSQFRYINDMLHKQIINGKYKIDRDGSISFIPYKKSYKGKNYLNKIDLHLSSSTVKTFFSLDFYIEHMAKKILI